MDFSLIKKLRDATSASVKDCKLALEETNGDIEESIQFLRKKGIIKAAKYSGNETTEGGIAVFESDDKLVVVKISCQTDFAAKSEGMISIYDEVAKHVFDVSSLDELKSRVEELVKNTSASCSENIYLADFRVFIKDDSHFVAYYVHNTYFKTFGRIAAVVSIDEADYDTAKEIAIHTAVKKPKYLQESEIPADVLEKEIEVCKTLAEGNDRKLEGMIAKFKQESCLASQKFTFDDSKTISKMLGKAKINEFGVWWIGV